MQRRTFLQAVCATGLVGGPVRLAFAGSQPSDARFCLILLRGGLDGLAAVQAPGDPAFAGARGAIAPNQPGLALDELFALHPSLEGLRPMWDRKELLVAHAVASPYAERSHFDGQNVLENGTTEPYGLGSGWLNRAMVGGDASSYGLAAGATVPLVLRGVASVSSADLERAPRVPEPLMTAAAALYANDPLFGPALNRGQQVEQTIAKYRVGADHPAVVVGRTFADPAGPRIAVLSMGGWDTHTAQERTLNGLLTNLAETVDGIRLGAGAAWPKTVVAVVTEFGRRVAGNGTGGTDHGVGGVAFLAGGSVAGGRVLSDWPGLAEDERLEGRDLRPTLDIRALFKGVLHDHLSVAQQTLDREVFPDSTKVKPLQGLLRA